MSDDSPARVAARLTAFAVAGAVTTAQEVVSDVLREIPSADTGLVAEETLSLIAAASARAMEASKGTLAAPVAAALIELPFVYHDYLLGGIMLAQPEADQSLDRSVFERLLRKRDFYLVHLVPGQLPSRQVLKDKMELWMGRVSPPGLPEHPAKRLEKLSLVDTVTTHVRLVFEFARKEESTRATPS